MSIEMSIEYDEKIGRDLLYVAFLLVFHEFQLAIICV